MMIVALLSMLSAGLLTMIGGGDEDLPPEESNEDLPQQPPQTQFDDTAGQLGPDPFAAPEPTEEELADHPRPPTGEDFRDPLIVAEELEAAEAIARAPETLLSAFDASGAEVPDGSLLANSSGVGDEADRDYIVVPNGEDLDITVGYHMDTTFLVELGDTVDTLRIGLNSDVAAAAGTIESSAPVDVEQGDETIQQITQTRSFEAATQITLEVDAEAIGSHVAQIDLSNPNDTLHLQFDPFVNGNLHLVTDETEMTGLDDSIVTRTVYVIETPPEVRLISPGEISQLLAGNAGDDVTGRIVAEVHLGEDHVSTNGSETIIRNFVNETPQITTNIAWASQGEHNEIAAPSTSATGSGGGTSTTPTGNGGNTGSLIGDTFGGVDLGGVNLNLDDLDLIPDVPTTNGTTGSTTGTSGTTTDTTGSTAPDFIVDLFENDPNADLEQLEQDLANLTPDELAALEDLVNDLNLPGNPSPNTGISSGLTGIL